MTFMGPTLFAALLTATFIPSATAETLYINNNCAYELYYWSVSPGVHVSDNSHQIVSPYSMNFLSMDTKTSVSLKIRDLPVYEQQPAGIIQAEYSLHAEESRWFYDLSYIDCNQHAPATDLGYCPFAHGGVKMYSEASGVGNCKIAHCQLGGNECDFTYLVEGGFKDEPSLNCPAGYDFFVETCVDGSGERTNPDLLDIPDDKPVVTTPTPASTKTEAPVATGKVFVTSIIKVVPTYIPETPWSEEGEKDWEEEEAEIDQGEEEEEEEEEEKDDVEYDEDDEEEEGENDWHEEENNSNHQHNVHQGVRISLDDFGKYW